MYVAVNFDEDGITPTEVELVPTTFKDLNLKERHLEEFIRRNIDLLFEDDESLLIVGQQVRNASRGISDLTAIDSDGNIVLIEIKRDLDDSTGRKEPFEVQAIRYAASYAKITNPEDIVGIYSSYIENHPEEHKLENLTAAEQARRNLDLFLERTNALKTFNHKQRIILIASDFDDQMLSAVAWLIANGIDISCIAITPVQTGTMDFLQIERVLPPVSLDDFYVELVSKDGVTVALSEKLKGKTKKRYLPRMKKLFDWGLVKAEDQLEIKGQENSAAVAVDVKQVRYNGELMSYNDWAKLVTGWSAMNVYEWSIHCGTGRTLHEMRLEKMAEIEEEKAVQEEQIEGDTL